MKLAVIQPNFFPYEAYYDLTQRVDKVIFLDDAPYSSKNWVNKTLLKIKKKNYYFRIPTDEERGATTLTRDLKIKDKKWKKKFIRLIKVQYQNYPNFKYVFPIVEEIVNLPTDNLSNIAAYSVYRISNLLNPNTQFTFSSKKYQNIKRPFLEKVIQICKKEKATTFYTFSKNVNTFNERKFFSNNIKVSYFRSYSSNFSMIDSLMSKYSYYQVFQKECNLS